MNQLIQDIIQRGLAEIRKDEVKRTIETELVNPIIMYSMRRIYPYFIALGVVFGAILILAIMILYYIVRRQHTVNVEFGVGKIE
jgi:hypothetical protein